FCLTGINGGTYRARSAECEPCKLQSDCRIQCRCPYQVERIGIGCTLVQQFEPVVDCTDGRDHIMADTTTKKCRKIGPIKREIRVPGHVVLLMLITQLTVLHQDCANMARLRP